MYAYCCIEGEDCDQTDGVETGEAEEIEGVETEEAVEVDAVKTREAEEIEGVKTGEAGEIESAVMGQDNVPAAVEDLNDQVCFCMCFGTYTHSIRILCTALNVTYTMLCIVHNLYYICDCR